MTLKGIAPYAGSKGFYLTCGSKTYLFEGPDQIVDALRRYGTHTVYKVEPGDEYINIILKV